MPKTCETDIAVLEVLWPDKNEWEIEAYIGPDRLLCLYSGSYLNEWKAMRIRYYNSSGELEGAIEDADL